MDLKVIDEVLPEPAGGAHADHAAAAKTLHDAVVRHLDELKGLKPDKLVRKRREKYLKMGAFTE
jgi:acetyl-CoA carboxylase carboxyl transferase subunit alpha